MQNYLKKEALTALAEHVSKTFGVKSNEMVDCIAEFEHEWFGTKSVITPKKPEPTLKEKLKASIEKLPEGRYYNVTSKRQITKNDKNKHLLFFDKLKIAGEKGNADLLEALKALDYKPSQPKKVTKIEDQPDEIEDIPTEDVETEEEVDLKPEEPKSKPAPKKQPNKSKPVPKKPTPKSKKPAPPVEDIKVEDPEDVNLDEELNNLELEEDN